MPYIKSVYHLRESNKFEYKFAGMYGKSGEKKARTNPSPEQIKRQNQWTRQRKIEYLIEDNFYDDDLWMTLKYPAGCRPSSERVKKDFEKFRRNTKNWYEKQGAEFKYIYRAEIGKRGGVHIHILANWIDGAEKAIKKRWHHSIRDIADTGKSYIYYAPMQTEGAHKLAEYIAKAPDDVIEGQLELFPELENRNYFLRVNSSRNLKRPVPETKTYSRRTLEKTIRDGIVPTEGYYVEPDSVICGINPVTGYSYLYYSERKLKKPTKQERVRVRMRGKFDGKINSGKGARFFGES